MARILGTSRKLCVESAFVCLICLLSAFFYHKVAEGCQETLPSAPLVSQAAEAPDDPEAVRYAEEAHRRPIRNPPYKLALCSIFQNEARYMKEWLVCRYSFSATQT